MSYYEYRVVPAPKSIPKVKGVKAPSGRFAVSMAEALNAEGRDGWEFQRSETIETEVKKGFLSKARPEVLTVLVFRRWVETEAYEAPAHSARAAPEESFGPEDMEVSEPVRPQAQSQARPTLSARREEPANAFGVRAPRRD